MILQIFGISNSFFDYCFWLIKPMNLNTVEYACYFKFSKTEIPASSIFIPSLIESGSPRYIS